jgi:hypothetical protein
MFRRDARSSKARVPEPEVTDASRAVDATIGPHDDTVHIDAKTGHVMRTMPDGRVRITPMKRPEEDRKRRSVKSFNDNLAEDLDEVALQRIASVLLNLIDQDQRSRVDWETTCQKGASLIGVTLEEASADIGPDGLISKVKHTGLLQATITSWANSRSELLPVGGPVKVRDDEQTNEMETAIAEGMNGGIGHNGGPPLGDNVVPFPNMQGAAANTGIAAAAPPSAMGAPPPPNAGPPGASPPATGIAAPQMPQGPQGAPAAPAAPPVPPPAPSEKRNALAEALQGDMNHYLTVVDEDYYPDFSRMLVSRALLGSQFRKVYHDPILRRPVSRWVKGTDLIVSNDASSLSGAARITERIQMRQLTVKRLQKIGHWRNVALVLPTTTPTPMDRKIAETEGIRVGQDLPESQLHTIYECYTDLDEDPLTKDEKGKDVGFALPYRITIDKDSRRVLEIRRNWKQGDELYLKRKRYVKYGHVPGLGFYDWGFVHLIGNPARGATMMQKCLIDTGMLNSFPGGLMRKSPGTRQRTTDIRPGLGEWITVDTGGLPIQDFAMPMPYKEPSAVLQAVGSDLASQMKQVAGLVELPVGEGMANIPVGTIMTYIDAVTKVPGAVHKDDHIAQQQEYILLKELVAEDPSTLWKFAKNPKRKWSIGQEISDQDLVPAADPNVPSQVHRLMQTQMLVQNGGLPQFAGIANQRTIWERMCRTVGASNTGEYTMPAQAAAPPPPDPRIVAAQIKSQDTAKTLAAKAAETQAKTQSDLEKARIESADKDADRLSEEKRAAMAESRAAIEAHADVAKHAITTGADHLQHTDTMHAKAAELVQDHVQHLDSLTADAQKQASQQDHETTQSAVQGAQQGVADNEPSPS